MDRTRLEPSIQEMTSAEVAYDSALRLLADATRRATQQPLDATVAAQLQIANEELAQARTRVEAARVALDVTRIAELSTLSAADQLLGAIPGHQVIGLFPVGLEGRLEAGRLRVRVWPDAISTSTHDPRLLETELAATKAYWRAEAAARNAAVPGPVDNEASREAWRDDPPANGG